METPFSTVRDRYDMETFSGRLKHRLALSHPRLIFDSTSTLRSYQATLAKFDRGEATGKSNEELWSMRTSIESSVHPTTNEVLNPLFRMAAYMPMNIPIVTAMTMPMVAANGPATALVHVANQSYNCAINYANRSGDAQSNSALMQGFAAALVTSLGGAYGTTQVMKRVGTQGTRASIIRGTLPYTTVCLSGCANVSIMRLGEWRTDGVPVKDEDGEVRGKSKAAARLGLSKCCVSRFLWNIPAMMLPPMMSAALVRFPYFAARPVALMAMEGVACIAGIMIGLPMALAAFKPIDSITPDTMEPEFRGLKRKNGEAVKKFTYYKGM